VLGSKRRVKILLINNSILYSLKKIKEKKIEEYSVLNPLTNSDSPSGKSNGAR
jgi:hypothetical protein